MSRFRSLAPAGAMGLAAVLFPLSVNALPPAFPNHGVGSDVVPARAVCNAYSCWNFTPLYSPFYRPYYNPIYQPYYRSYYWPIYRPYYRPYYNGPYNRPYYPPYRTYYQTYDSPYYAPAYGNYDSHVTWCLNRYRTYDPGTNRYHAGGGVYRVCSSPYR
ncbi:hypothetical protein J2Y48_000463 [Mycoplana sp. BE70]|uniref:BA14K family protein n=1 Tax=Mycoplana sp. BE70 TaxID=2817775 RepID=UPI002854C6A4|nr:BA14K family protein [Mycoplana sp. BE70]MDR6755190.1 hypothetical protein [Mycoplana sp. BE70]